jgi:molecular chaperone HscB
MTNTTVNTPNACWSCQAEQPAATHFCVSCKKIQALGRGIDYFALLGLPRKLQMDEAKLEALFHELSWQLHPDNFVRASDFERQLSLERSSQLNDAFRTLREPVTRVEYLLSLYGMRKEGEKKQQAPPELLEEVFELNEALDELRAVRTDAANGDEFAALKQRLEAERKKFEALLADVDAELAAVAREWDAAFDASADETKQRELMNRMNEILNRRSYIRNLIGNVQKELVES